MTIKRMITKRSWALAAALCCTTLLTLDHAAAAAEPAAKAGAKLDAASTLRIARSLRKAGDAASAAAMFRQLASQQPADMDLQVELGETLLEANLIDDAIGVFGAAPAASRAGGRAELGLAHAYLKLDQLHSALEHAQRAVTLTSGAVDALVDSGVILDRLGRHAEAQASYRRALEKAPRSIAARSDLALSIALTGQHDEAIAMLEPIAKSANATPRDRQNLAFVYGLKGETDKALSLGRADLDEATAQANARYYEFTRNAAPERTADASAAR